MQANIKVKRGGAEGVVYGCAWMVFAACGVEKISCGSVSGNKSCSHARQAHFGRENHSTERSRIDKKNIFMETNYYAAHLAGDES